MDEIENVTCSIHPESLLEWDGFSWICADCVLAPTKEEVV